MNYIPKDKNGVVLKYPNRTCKECKKYPCMDNQEILKSNCAKHGCKKFENIFVIR